MPVPEAWQVSPTHCPRCRVVPLPWSAKLRLHTACNSWVEERIVTKKRREEKVVAGQGEIQQLCIYQPLSDSSSWLEIVSTLERKDERMKEMKEELRKLDLIVEVQQELIKLEAFLKMKEGVRKMEDGSEVKRKRRLSQCTETDIIEVVHVDEDKKKEIIEVGSAELVTEVCSEVKVNPVSHLGEEKKEVLCERQTMLGGKTIQCPPDIMRKKISDLRRQEVIIEEKEAKLRKIVKRREKIGEKERDCLAEMKDVRKKLKILKRCSENQKRL